MKAAPSREMLGRHPRARLPRYHRLAPPETPDELDLDAARPETDPDKAAAEQQVQAGGGGLEGEIAGTSHLHGRFLHTDTAIVEQGGARSCHTRVLAAAPCFPDQGFLYQHALRGATLLEVRYSGRGRTGAVQLEGETWETQHLASSSWLECSTAGEDTGSACAVRVCTSIEVKPQGTTPFLTPQPCRSC